MDLGKRGATLDAVASTPAGDPCRNDRRGDVGFCGIPLPRRAENLGDLSDLVDRAPRLKLTGDYALYHEGDDADQIYYVASGIVALHLSTEQGHEVEVGERTAGSLVGIEALVASTYDSSARACRQTIVHALDRRDVAELVERNQALRVALFRSALSEIGDARRRLLDLAGRCAKERLAVALLRLAVTTDGRSLVSLPWGSKARLARKIGIKQETLSRVFQDLIEENLIRILPGGVELLDARGIRNIADQVERTALRS